MRIRNVLLALSIALISTATAENPVVVMATNHGNIRIELDREKAPVTVANFLRYVEEKQYSGALFHRTVSNFVIQGGGYRLADDKEEEDAAAVELTTRAPILNEAKASGLKNLRGTISMARIGSDPNSATAQFFINVVDNSGSLDAGGTVLIPDDTKRLFLRLARAKE